MKIHKCNGCGKSEPEVRFRTRTVGGRRYKKHLCNVCLGEYNKRFPKSDKATTKMKARLKKYHSNERLDPAKTAKVILGDCKSSDQKKKRECDLTLEFVERTIAKGCEYCDEQSGRMTLDRIDNSLGHLRLNVRSACLRCNYLRRDIPYSAWLEMVPSVRSAREKGLFGEWNGSTKKKQILPD
jgi:protein-arginine kinase activator protein McsA